MRAGGGSRLRSMPGSSRIGRPSSSGRAPASRSPQVSRSSAPSRQAAPRMSSPRVSSDRGGHRSVPSVGSNGHRIGDAPVRKSPKVQPSSPSHVDRPQRRSEAPSAPSGLNRHPIVKAPTQHVNPIDRSRSAQPKSEQRVADGLPRSGPASDVGSQKKLGAVSNPSDRGVIQPRVRGESGRRNEPRSDSSPKALAIPDAGALASGATRSSVVPEPAGRRADSSRRFSGRDEFKSRRGTPGAPGDGDVRGKHLVGAGYNHGARRDVDIDIDVDVDLHRHNYGHSYYDSWYPPYHAGHCYSKPWYYPTRGFSLGFGYSRQRYDCGYDYCDYDYYDCGSRYYPSYYSSYSCRSCYSPVFADYSWYRPVCYLPVTTVYSAPIVEEVTYYDWYPYSYSSYIPTYSYSYGWPCVGFADYADYDSTWYASVSYWD